jgi:hypothetical protein
VTATALVEMGIDADATSVETNDDAILNAMVSVLPADQAGRGDAGPP